MERDIEQEVTLDNLAGGAANEAFQAALAQVVENTLDPNTDAQHTRKVVITLAVTPKSADRREVNAVVRVSTTLAPANRIGTTLYFGKAGGKHVAVGVDKRQIPLFQPEGRDVVPMKPAANTGE